MKGRDRNKEKTYTLREEVNALVSHSLRNNTSLETLHAGTEHPDLKDPMWSRITDKEMKKLMIEVCDNLELVLLLKERYPDKYEEFVQLMNKTYCSKWQKVHSPCKKIMKAMGCQKGDVLQVKVDGKNAIRPVKENG